MAGRLHKPSLLLLYTLLTNNSRIKDFQSLPHGVQEMTSTTSLSLTSKLDLRASVFTRLRRGTGVRWLRVFTLILLDISMLYLAWQLAANYGNSLYSPLDTRHSPLLSTLR